MLGVYDEKLNVFSFEQVHDRFPEHASALHGHVGAPMFLNPINEFEKIDSVGTKRLDLLSFGRNDASCNVLLMNVQSACSFDENIHETHLSTANRIEGWCNNQIRVNLPCVLLKRERHSMVHRGRPGQTNGRVRDTIVHRPPSPAVI